MWYDVTCERPISVVVCVAARIYCLYMCVYGLCLVSLIVPRMEAAERLRLLLLSSREERISPAGRASSHPVRGHGGCSVTGP